MSNFGRLPGPVVAISMFATMPDPDSSDDHERFTRLLLEAEPVMLRSILVVVPHLADAREILQETAVALWRRFDSYDPDRPFLNWAMGFARIETRRFRARQRRRAQLTEKAMEALEAEMDRTPEFLVALERHLAACLGKLADRQRRLIRGYYQENRTVEWLAKTEGRSVEATYKAMQRIRQGLQRCIERRIKEEPV